jgi:hypothetical protein
MNAAARRPAEGDGDISDVKRYIAKAVNPENPGASKTQIFRISTGNVRNRRTW